MTDAAKLALLQSKFAGKSDLYYYLRDVCKYFVFFFYFF